MSDPSGSQPQPGNMLGPGSNVAPAPHPGSLRPEAISSAVSFLTDPKVGNAPLSQRISFLESKGLSASEIDAAITQTNVVAQRGMMGGPPPPGYGYGMPPQAQQQGRDWRDWFIMAVVSGTIGYGLVSLARVRLRTLPLLKLGS